MIVLLVVLSVLVVGGVTGLLVWLAASRQGALDAQTLSEPTSSSSHEPLPAAVTPGSVDGLRFDQVLRGYSMRQVDAVLDRLRDELALRDAEIARLRHELDQTRAAGGYGPTGDPELGHGPVVRAGDGASIWAPRVHSYQASDGAGEHVTSDAPAARPAPEPRPADDH